MTTQLRDDPPAVEGDRRPLRVSARRVQIGQLLAFVALLAAFVGALGPADDVRTTYSWPPETLPAGTPSSLWYAPLLLVRQEPESVSATMPCALSAPLPRADGPVTVLSTARSPERSGGLVITQMNRRLTIRVGSDLLLQVGLRAAADPSCAYRLELGGGRWSLSGGPGDSQLTGSLGRMPVVTGLFSAVDLRAGDAPAIEVTTQPHAEDTSVRQSVAWSLAVVCALAALLLVAIEARPRPGPAIHGALRSAARHIHSVDAVVAVILAGWWVLSPAFADDGWIVARERMFSVSGGFTQYYTAFGANLANDYWLEWLQHWLADSPLLVLRIPALLCLAATWVLCRWILSRVLDSTLAASGVALWALAASFLTVALAWGMTMRPEPVTALFVAAVLACTVHFLERGTAAPLAAAAVLVPFGLTAHHSAVAAFAPLLAAAPALFRWVRGHVAAAATVVTASVALVLVPMFVGADLEQRREDARIAPLFQPDTSWRDEILRYVLLLDIPPFATPLRRASVALIALALAAFLLRRRRTGGPLLDLPATSLGIALLLFVVAPTKHAWHFGALLGLAAVAVAAETARFRDDGAREPGWSLRPLVAIGVALVAIAWSWLPRHAWNEVDLRSLDWTLGLERVVDLQTLALVLPLVLFVVLVLLPPDGRRRAAGSEASWRVASWSAPLVTAPLLLFTVAVLAADTAKTGTWTLARQNLGALTGDAGCGLADDLVVPIPGSARALAIAADGDARSAPWVPPAPVAELPRYALGPGAEGVPAASPWFRLPQDASVGLFVSGTPAAGDQVKLEWGRLRQGAVEPIGARELSAGLEPEAGAVLPWRFLAAGELPPAEPNADAVRVVLRTEHEPGAAIAVTAPVTYSNEDLAQRLERPGARSLVMPSLVPFFPCAQLPLLRDGVVEAPGEIVLPRSSTSPLRFPGSPFLGLLDLYGLERLPLADSANPPAEVVAFAVTQLSGRAIASPTRERHVGSG